MKQDLEAKLKFTKDVRDLVAQHATDWIASMANFLAGMSAIIEKRRKQLQDPESPAPPFRSDQ